MVNSIGYHLGKTESEIRSMEIDELARWYAYIVNYVGKSGAGSARQKRRG